MINDFIRQWLQSRREQIEVPQATDRLLLESYIGKQAQCLTPLRCTGYVCVEGKILEAYSRYQFFGTGDWVWVIDVRFSQLVVAALPPEPAVHRPGSTPND